MAKSSSYDVAVIGAGVFGAWSALHLAKRGQRVLLVDAYGPGHTRSSSGDESRIIRMGYGADEIYTQWSLRSLAQWKDLFAATRNEALFRKTGVLWLAEENNAQLSATQEVLARNAVPFEELGRGELEKRYAQVNFEGIGTGILEPESGVLLARRAVAATAAEAVRRGAEFRLAAVKEVRGRGRAESVVTAGGEELRAGAFVFACGAWLGKLFPQILGSRIFPTRQAVFYFAIPAGDARFGSPALPTWLFKNDECYGMPDIECRGLKVAIDKHGEAVDPDTQSRIVTAQEVKEIQEYVAYRFPALGGAPIAETRVCQYENTSSGDFLIDRHPELANVWFAGGGSGHGFKHGPAVGEHVARLLSGEASAEPRFSLASKKTQQLRAVY
ncbi:MAG TPA: FAD-dependent oxidoreductase [Dongiaceae bacterium]|nr:FAD-dependent oxidoreductase [Dongiaceae bacterium]